MKNDVLINKKDSPMQKVQKLIELQAIYKDIKPQIDELKAELLQITQELDVLTLKTGDYTITRAKKITPQVINYSLLKQTLIDQNIPFQIKETFADHMKETFKEAIKEGKELAGLEGLETEYITIRIK